jgi:uncharacterized protein YndB with AHSA1/START domain
VLTHSLAIAREYDLPAAIVWDALVDEVLVEGWLAGARIDPRVGGEYLLSWMSGQRLDPTNGVITAFEADRRLAIDTDNIGSLEFILEPIAGGTRGTATRLRLTITVDTDPRLLASTHAYWQTNFDQLEDLLRGHPVDWTTWQEDRGEAWAAHLQEASQPN